MPVSLLQKSCVGRLEGRVSGLKEEDRFMPNPRVSETGTGRASGNSIVSIPVISFGGERER